MLQVVIVAGGEGVRLRPLTEKTPKSMTPVQGKPYLEYQLQMLKKHGFRDIVMCIGYLGDQIRSYFGDGSKLDLNITYSIEKELLGTGGAIKNAETELDDDFFVMWGDNFLELDFTEMLSEYEKAKTAGMISVYRNTEKRVDHNVFVDDENYVRIYKKREELEEMNGVEAGVSIFNKKILEYIPVSKKISLEEQIYPKLIEEHQLKCYWTDVKYYDIGTFERLKIFEEVLQ